MIVWLKKQRARCRNWIMDRLWAAWCRDPYRGHGMPPVPDEFRDGFRIVDSCCPPSIKRDRSTPA